MVRNLIRIQAPESNFFRQFMRFGTTCYTCATKYLRFLAKSRKVPLGAFIMSNAPDRSGITTTDSRLVPSVDKDGRQKKVIVDELFQLKDERQVALMELNQRYTYEGFKDGIPTRDFNSKYLALLVADSETTSEQLLISPTETLAEIPGTANFAMLPAVTCNGRFSMFKRVP